MCRLSVNLNKVALIRNARGSDFPNLLQVALDCERYGAQGITVHPRPDERHVKYEDLYVLGKHIRTELNIEGYPDFRFLNAILEVRPEQCTLVPDAPNALTSTRGWDCIENFDILKEVCAHLRQAHVRSSIFIDPVAEQVEAAKELGADCVELYTGPYVEGHKIDPYASSIRYQIAGQKAYELGLRVHAGHDLNLHNLRFLYERLPYLSEVSIGHALVVDALYMGFKSSIRAYRQCLE